MCLSHTRSILAPPPPVRDADDSKTFSVILDAMARRPARPSWTLRGVLKQPSSGRPGLPRRFSTKINLNEYWGVLEKVVKVDSSWRQHAEEKEEESAMDVDKEVNDNEVNDNLANERAEAKAAKDKMEVDTPPTPCEDIQEVRMMDSIADLPLKDTAKVDEQVVLSPRKKVSLGKRIKSRRRSAPQEGCPASPCATPPTTPPCGASPSPRRVPLGTLNGMESRGQLKKSLSPLTMFADNLARRLSRQH